MRVLIAHSIYRSAGGENRYVERQVSLLGRDHAAAVFAERNEELGSSLSSAAKMMYSSAAVKRAKARINSFKPDVIHVHNIYPALGPSIHIAAERCGVPLVMTVHNYRLRCPNGLLYTEGARCHRCVRGNHLHAVLHDCFPTRRQSGAYAVALWLHRFILRLEQRVKLFIAPSAFVRDQLCAWGIPETKVRLLHNFAETDPGASEQPGEAGVYLGRLAPEKGLDVLLEALHAAGDPPFLVVGEGSQENALKQQASRLSLLRTKFVGAVTAAEAREILHRARYIALPSQWYENAPLAALEAMAAGRPLLVSDSGGLPELAQPPTGPPRGLVYPAGSSSRAAQSIRNLTTSDDLCRSLGMAGKDAADTIYSPSTHLRGLLACYQSALEQ